MIILSGTPLPGKRLGVRERTHEAVFGIGRPRVAEQTVEEPNRQFLKQTPNVNVKVLTSFHVIFSLFTSQNHFLILLLTRFNRLFHFLSL